MEGLKHKDIKIMTRANEGMAWSLQGKTSLSAYTSYSPILYNKNITKADMALTGNPVGHPEADGYDAFPASSFYDYGELKVMVERTF